MSTYVYGIARASQGLPHAIDGIGEPPLPVRTVRAGELVALVSDAPTELKAKRRDLLAHQRVVIQAQAGGPVLPMRFGGVSPDDDAVGTVLSEHHDQYLERLEALAGRDEFNVKANHDEEAVLFAVLAADPELRARHQANRSAGGGTHEDKLLFGELVARAVSERERADAVLIAETLAPLTRGVHRGPESTGWLANLSFLVDRERREDFLAAVRALHEQHEHLQVQVTGPLPPYSFADAG
ncbi:GvpL/GvpF family gas vesicle protein [Streptomyces sp. NBC_01565]|uniref:GvpL/GvpF family gas vesicle protein n=1 Tax=unclassified Streptomyces TaxID=2593676 RepID=UPI002259650B|nr:GvpL/GvpF family gas vesicle protein [Streptomyces sp. NBC_01565]MCX4547131.1 GvpL/GvpF family gas vesicle protein [Streptomyces sp. NBC_01565]